MKIHSKYLIALISILSSPLVSAAEDEKFDALDFENITQAQRVELAKYFVQRKRANIKRWLNEDTPFPERETKEIGYTLNTAYKNFYTEVLSFAQGITRKGEKTNKGAAHYWAALALLRGVMSSPRAGLDMLKAKRKSIQKAAVSTFGYIAKSIGPQDVLHTLLNNLKVQERQMRVCTTVAIAGCE